MKKLIKNLPLLTFILFCQITHAQETKDYNFILGGDFHFNMQKNGGSLSEVTIFPLSFTNNFIVSDDNLNRSLFRFNPYVGKRINANFLVGINLGLALSKFKGESNTLGINGIIETTDFEQSQRKFTIGLMSRYIVNPSNRINFFIEPLIGYSRGTSTNTIEGIEEGRFDVDELFVSFKPGLYYKANKTINLVLRLNGVSYITGKEDWLNKTRRSYSSFVSSFNLRSIAFGVEFKL